MQAAEVPFVAGLNIDSISTTGSQWYVSGQVRDYTVAGHTGLDVPTNALIVCESEIGDVDLYVIDQLVTATVARIWAYISYVADDTNVTPRVGGPTFGEAQICGNVGQVPMTAQNAPYGTSPYLRDGIYAYAVRKIAGQAEDVETWRATMTAATGAWWNVLNWYVVTSQDVARIDTAYADTSNTVALINGKTNVWDAGITNVTVTMSEGATNGITITRLGRSVAVTAYFNTNAVAGGGGGEQVWYMCAGYNAASDNNVANNTYFYPYDAAMYNNVPANLATFSDGYSRCSAATNIHVQLIASANWFSMDSGNWAEILTTENSSGSDAFKYARLTSAGANLYCYVPTIYEGNFDTGESVWLRTRHYNGDDTPDCRADGTTVIWMVRAQP